MVDAKGHLWVTDFGLARLQNDSGLTITGDVIGTLRYMSPEQALGRRVLVDARTDIYSLGVTLYELLTLLPAFESTDRQELLRQIADEEPRSPRRLNASIPRELETIILKAMSKETESRYATAQQLADDLRRFQEDKPIKARRPSPAERAAKWARRHRMLVATAFLFLLLAVGVLSTSTVMVARKQRELERQRDEARQAVDDMYADVAQQWMGQQAAFEPLQQKFLRKALSYYERFAADEGSEPGHRFKAAVAYRRVGEMEEKLGHSSEAKLACRAATRILEALLAAAPSEPEYQCELAMNEAAMARLAWDEGPERDSEKLLRSAIARLKNAASRVPSESRYRRELARSYGGLGRVLRDKDRPACQEALRQAVALLEQLAAESPSAADLRRQLAMACTNLGLVLGDTGGFAEAEPYYRRAVELSEKLVADFPTTPDYRYALGQSLHNMGVFLGAVHRNGEIEQFYRRAVEVLERLAADSPSVSLYESSLAMSVLNLGATRSEAGRYSEAEPVCRRANALYEKVARTAPSTPGVQRFLAYSHNNLGGVLERTGRLVEAEAQYRGALALLERLAGGAASAENCQRDVAGSRQTLANLLYRAGRPLEAEQECRKSVAILTGLAEPESQHDLARILITTPLQQLRDPQTALRLAKKAVEQRPHMSEFWNTLGIANYRFGAWQAAIEAFEKSHELNAWADPSGWFFLAMAHWQKGDKATARSWYGKAAHWMEESKSQDDELLRFRDEAAALLGVAVRSTPTSWKEKDPKQTSKP
jgi:tetratricopeptide (TPR) repeat protein